MLWSRDLVMPPPAHRFCPGKAKIFVKFFYCVCVRERDCVYVYLGVGRWGETEGQMEGLWLGGGHLWRRDRRMIFCLQSLNY